MADGGDHPVSEYILTADYFDQIVERREDGTAKRYAKRRRGDVLGDLDDADVERLIAADAIAPVGEIVASEVVNEEQGDGPGDTAPVPAVASEVPIAPKKTAALAEWQAYGIARGLSAAEADGLTRAELIERFGA